MELPKIFECDGDDAPSLVREFIDKLIAYHPDEEFIYCDQVIVKLQEYLRAVDEFEDYQENAFFKKMRENWSSGISSLLVKSDVQFELNLRRKALFSLFYKINKTMREGRSIDSIHDIIGIEFIIFTPTTEDTATTVKKCFCVANRTLDFFCSSRYHQGDIFSLVDSGGLKEPADTKNPDDIAKLKSMNPGIYIPAKTGILPKYESFVKDYITTPKITTAYQGIQYVVLWQGMYIEIQIKSQPMREYLDYANSPGSHIVHKEHQAHIGDSKVMQFDLSYNTEKLIQKIAGFRSDPHYDKSGIMAPVKWELRKSTHHHHKK